MKVFLFGTRQQKANLLQQLQCAIQIIHAMRKLFIYMHKIHTIVNTLHIITCKIHGNNYFVVTFLTILLLYMHVNYMY